MPNEEQMTINEGRKYLRLIKKRYGKASKEVVGFGVDLVREFAKRWLGDENAVELVQVTS